MKCLKDKTREGGCIVYHIWDNTDKYNFTLEQSEENRTVFNLYKIGNSIIIKSISAYELDTFINELQDFIAKISK